MKTVGIAELKARLSEYLRAVRRGNTVLVLDRDTPIAQIVPLPADSDLRIREPVEHPRGLQSVPLPPPVASTFDAVAVLLEERQGER